jgi:hypothetical protein
MKLSEKHCPPILGGQFFKFVYYAISVSAPVMSSSARMNVLIVYIVHEATPKAPARAVSRVMRILRMETHPFPPSMEGDTESFV